MTATTPTKPSSELNVIVTGFSPWGDGTPWLSPIINASHILATSLPRILFRPSPLPNIRIWAYPHPVPTAWTPVRKLVPRLWDGEKGLFLPKDEIVEGEGGVGEERITVDAVLHLGILDKPKEAFRLERRAFKGLYVLPGVDGKVPTEEDRNGGGRWGELPESLETRVDVDGVLDRVRKEITDAEITVSDELELFLCGFLYYNSIAETCLRGEDRRVVFLHIPIEHESEDIEKGVGVVSAVVRAMVDDLYGK